jgi:excisionase family DNA binding protein
MSAQALIYDDPRDVEIARLKAELADLRASLPAKPPVGWINVKSAAAILGVSRSLVYKWVRHGKLRSFKPCKRIWIDPSTLKGV